MIPLIRKKHINVHEVLEKSFPDVLIKDLQDDERICLTCRGLGMVVRNTPYGIRDDTSDAGKKKMFPYNNYYFSLCPDCFWGVQKLCRYCWKPYPKGTYICDCEGYKKEKEQKRIAQWREIVDKANPVDEKSVSTMLYCEETDEYFDSVDDFLDTWACIHEENEEFLERPVRLWVTEILRLQIDAENIVVSACEELHEDAYEYCDTKSLQELLNKWCSDQTGTDTYIPSYKEYVVIDWNKYKKGEM